MKPDSAKKILARVVKHLEGKCAPRDLWLAASGRLADLAFAAIGLASERHKQIDYLVNGRPEGAKDCEVNDAHQLLVGLLEELGFDRVDL